MTGVYLKNKLNILSCAVEGRPGRSAYDQAVAAGYTGSLEDYSALLAMVPEAVVLVNTVSGRVDAMLEYLGNQIGDLQLQMEDLSTDLSTLLTRTAELEQRVTALEG